ncbi:MAG: hypothetical protein Q7R74_00170 [bacterium]|nr:hypothetical protein [bacterium]
MHRSCQPGLGTNIFLSISYPPEDAALAARPVAPKPLRGAEPVAPADAERAGVAGDAFAKPDDVEVTLNGLDIARLADGV